MTSEFGSQFTLEQATQAVDGLNVDWNAEAVENAQSLSDSLALSCPDLIDQMTSEFGSQFTPEQAAFGAEEIGLC